MMIYCFHCLLKAGSIFQSLVVSIARRSLLCVLVATFFPASFALAKTLDLDNEYISNYLYKYTINEKMQPDIRAQDIPPNLNAAISRELSGAGEFPLLLKEHSRLFMEERPYTNFYRFGISVDIKGDIAIVGAPGPNFGIYYTPGEAYIFARQGSEWIKEARLQASDGRNQDFFGISVALSEDGNTAMIGASVLSFGGDAVPGAVYVFTRSENDWIEQDKLVPSDGVPPDLFGASISVSGDMALIGAPAASIDGNVYQGAAYIFVNDHGVWVEQEKLVTATGGALELFGMSVSISDDTALVGAPMTEIDGNFEQGAAYVFTHSGGSWIEDAVLTMEYGAAGDGFGAPVVVASADFVLIGASGANVENNVNQGVVNTFSNHQGAWELQEIVTISDGNDGAFFGSSISYSENTMIVGASGIEGGYGAAYLFLQGDEGWEKHQKLSYLDGVPGVPGLGGFGQSVGIDGNIAIVGAPGMDVNQLIQGSAYTYEVLALSSIPASIDFGPVFIGDVNNNFEVMLVNASLDVATITEISVPAGPFSYEDIDCGSLPFALASGDSCEIRLSYQPESESHDSVTVSIANSIQDNPLTIVIEGRGSASGIDVFPNIMDFGIRASIDMRNSKTAILSNTTGMAIDVISIDVLNTDDAFFRISGADESDCEDAPFELEPFETCALTYNFRPSNAESGKNSQSIVIDAVGDSENLLLLAELADRKLDVNPKSLSFGEINVNDASEPLAITLENTGNLDVLLLEISDSGHHFDFHSDTCDLDTYRLIPPGGSCELQYLFTPSEYGDLQTEIIVTTHMHPGSLASSFELAGTGLGASIYIEPDSLEVELIHGQSENSVVNVGNSGNVPLEWLVSEGVNADISGIVRTKFKPDIPETASPELLSGMLSKSITSSGFQGYVINEYSGNGEDITITHSDSLAIEPMSWIGCTNNNDGTSVQSQYLRVFTLADFDIHTAFDVSEVSFGLNSLTSAAPIGVNLYTLEGNELTYSNLKLVSSVTEELVAQELAMITMPVSGAVPPGGTLVVEVSVPDLTGIATAFPGFNDAGQTAPSYFSSVPCDFHEPVDLSDLNAADLHLVMSVTGVAEPLQCELPEWISTDVSGGTVAAGEFQPVSITLDASNVTPGEYSSDLCLSSNDPRRPFTVVPLSLDVLEPVPDIGVTPALVDFGSVPVGGSSGPVTVTVESTGTGILEVSSITAPGSGFALSGGSCTSLPFALDPGTSCTLDYIFTPPSEGEFNSIITITSNADPGTIGVALTGIGDSDGDDGLLFHDRFEEVGEP